MAYFVVFSGFLICKKYNALLSLNVSGWQKMSLMTWPRRPESCLQVIIACFFSEGHMKSKIYKKNNVLVSLL